MNFIKTLVCAAFLVLLASCAQVVPLSGGAKDTFAPKVVYSIPENKALHFSGKTIVIDFDEYIQLKDVANQFLINPIQRELPLVEARGKRLIVQFRDSLKKNTTYTLNFGNSICDIHENNPLQNYSYTFSTSGIIDSLTFEGTTTNLLNGKSLQNVFVGLYPSLDSTSIYYPVYTTYSNSTGEFRFEHLPQNEFYLLAFTDKNKNKLFDSDELISFLNEKVNFSDKVNLKLVSTISSSAIVKKAEWIHSGKARICFSNPVEKFKIIDETGENLQSKKNIRGDSIYVYFEKEVKDTTRIYVMHDNKIDSLQLVLKEKRKQEKIVILPAQSLNGKIMPCSELRFFVNRNFTKISNDAFLIVQSGDTLKSSQYKIIPFSPDSIKVHFDFTFSNSYRLIFLPGVVSDDRNEVNDTAVFSFTVKSQEEISTLSAQVFIKKEGFYIFQLLNNKEIVVQQKTICNKKNNSSEKIVFQNLYSGDYFLRVVYDTDKNNLFSSVSLEKMQQAEKVFLYDKPIQIPEGWETEINFVVE